jgi:hypothetical protein
MKIILPGWLVRALLWSTSTKVRFILVFGVFGWSGGMIAWNIHGIMGAPTIWLSLAQIGLLGVGGIFWGWLMWFVVRRLKRKAVPKNSN